MDFICLDKEYQNPIWLRPINVQWNACHYECGQFTIQIPTHTYEKSFAYVYCSEREQMGIIQKIFQEDTLEGKFTQISGFFMERMLHDYTIYDTENVVNKNVCQFAAELIRKYCNQDSIIIDDWGSLGENITLQITGGFLDETLFELLKTQKLTFRIFYDFVKDEIHIRFLHGVDRTQSQDVNNTITFSEDFKNLTNIRYNGDSSNYRNYARVMGEKGEGIRVMEIVDQRMDGERRLELYVDARDIQLTEEVTEEEYLEQLRARGVEKLMDFSDIRNISFDTENDMVKYREDYDLGDKVDVIVTDLQSSFEAEIIEVNEVLKKNQHTIELVLGDKIPTKYEKLMKG